MISSIPKWIGDLFAGVLRPNMKVLTTSYLSPQIKRIRFEGDITKMHLHTGYSNVIRVSETEYRNYTVACYDIRQGIFDMIFDIHGNGIGSGYIDGLKAGDELYISRARGRKEYDPKVKRHFIFGDETSFGVACSFLSALKQDQNQFEFYFELNEENKNVPQLLGLENSVVFPKNGSFSSEKWINDLPLFRAPELENTNFILTGNVRSVQTFKKALKSRAHGKIFAQGYWLEGKKGL